MKKTLFKIGLIGLVSLMACKKNTSFQNAAPSVNRSVENKISLGGKTIPSQNTNYEKYPNNDSIFITQEYASVAGDTTVVVRISFLDGIQTFWAFYFNVFGWFLVYCISILIGFCLQVTGA